MSMLPLPRYGEIMELVKTGLTIEAQEKIMALREGALELQEENLQLKARIRQLEEEAAVRQNYTFDSGQGVYWEADKAHRDGPYCAVCLDDKKKVIRLHRSCGQGGEWWHCKVCNSKF